MARFALAPVDIDDFRTSTGAFPFTVELNTDAATLWAELTGPRPLYWCRLLRQVRWTSPLPHSVGATRTATLAFTGIVLEERYFHWEEADGRYTKAFSVESTNTPGLRRFSEYYEVIATDRGCRFTWTFLVEPALPGLVRLARPVLSATLKQFITDTERTFN